MADSLRISDTRAEARRRLTLYRLLLALDLVAQLALGLVAILAPAWLSLRLGLPAPAAGSVRAFGIMQVVIAVFPVPGLVDPARLRWPNLAGIAAQFALALVFALLGVRLLAIGFLVAGAALAWTYWQLLRAELMTRP